MRLAGKVALVTGAGSGFGKGDRRAVRRRGSAGGGGGHQRRGGRPGGGGDCRGWWRGGIGDRRRKPEPRHGGEWWQVPWKRYGRLDVVVNNAGTTHRNRPMLEVDEDEFQRVFDVNVKSIYLSARHAVPVFRRQGSGVMVNIASTAGVRPRPGIVWYSATKGAVITMSKAMGAGVGAGTDPRGGGQPGDQRPPPCCRRFSPARTRPKRAGR